MGRPHHWRTVIKRLASLSEAPDTKAPGGVTYRLALASGLLGLLALRFGCLHSLGEVLSYDLFDFVHDHHMQARGFLDCGVRKSGVGGQIDIGQLTLEIRTCGDWFAEAILLIEIHEMQDVVRHRLRPGGVEGYNQLDRNILSLKLVGNVECGVRAQ